MNYHLRINIFNITANSGYYYKGNKFFRHYLSYLLI